MGVNINLYIQTNVHTCVHCMYSFDRGKRIRVFLSGDYEFLTRVYGLSGASG